MERCLEQHRGEYCVSSDPNRLDLTTVHDYLSKSYWSPGIPIEVIKRAMEGSICFCLFHRDSQIGFARVITDRATFAYLCDVYVLDDYQRQGLGHWLMEVVTSHPDLQGLRRFVLVTRDAHRLYERFGFLPLARPEGYMELHRPNVYSNNSSIAVAEQRDAPKSPVGRKFESMFFGGDCVIAVVTQLKSSA